MFSELVVTLALVAATIAVVGRLNRCPSDSKPLVQVVVLGDIGHSPRMQYHALGLAQQGKVLVELIGFPGSKPIPELSKNSSIIIRHIRPIHISPRLKVPFVVYAILKVVWESLQLLGLLLFTRYRPEVIMVQTPPAVPCMAVAALISKLTGSRLVVDFHNITYMHLGSKVKTPALLWAVRMYEQIVSRLATVSFCVTKSMAEFLRDSFRISRVYTLYDKPGPQFVGRTSPVARTDLEHRLKALGIMNTPFTAYDFIAVSSTSWTKDEDFGLVLQALPEYSRATAEKKTLLFITGKGELRDEFISKFNALDLKNIDLVTAWVPAADYPLVLGCANFGISVHTSTSGLDLPMKVVDMLGSELPVIAVNFPALKELLGAADEGGLTFSTGAELASCMQKLTVDVDATKNRDRLSAFGAKWRRQTFKSEWMSVVWPVLEPMILPPSRQARKRMEQ